jgi:tetratricopeptide (TPR) repeat protein
MRLEILVITLILTSLIAECEEGWSQYNGNGMSFNYPDSWLLVESQVGAIVGVPGVISLTFTMHREGCYPLSQHPVLLDWLLKAYGGRSLSGVPDGNPITQFFANEMGPYSDATQLYKNPRQHIFCEIQGYSAKNITVVIIQTVFDPADKNLSNILLDVSEIRKSFNVTLPETKYTADYWIQQGNELYNNGIYEIGLYCYNKSIELDPRNIEAWNNKGNAFAMLGKYNESIEAYNKAIEINLQYAEAWNNKGNTLSYLGRHVEAIQAYDKAIEIEPRFAKAWYNKGATLGEMSRYDEAIQAYDKAIEFNQQFAEAWYSKGLVLSVQRKYNDAIKAFDRAIDINSQYAEAWCSKGLALGSNVKYDEAIQALNKSIDINPKYAEAWHIKGMTLVDLGKTTEAKAAFAKAKDLGYTG